MSDGVADKTPGKHLDQFKWKPGVSPNPKGRPKGSRNALGEDFLKALHADFQTHGVGVIETVREQRPHEYLKVIASILPKELNVKTDALNDMSDDELAAILDGLKSAILAGSFAQGGVGDQEASGAAQGIRSLS